MTGRHRRLTSLAETCLDLGTRRPGVLVVESRNPVRCFRKWKCGCTGESRRKQRANRLMTRQSTCRPLAIATCAAFSMLSFAVEASAQTRRSRGSPEAGSTTAEELLEALRKRRPANEVIPPQSASRMGKVAAKLLPEGSAMIDRAGAITLDDPWWMFTPADGGKPIRLLPNLTLETMVRMSEASETSLLFAVSGELMVFDEANYLLVRSAPRAQASFQEQKASPMSPGSKERSGDNPDQKPAEVASDDSAADVLDVLRNQSRRRPVIPIADPVDRTDHNRGASDVARLLDGSALIDRPGRITRQGEWWTLVFESDHPDHPEPPMRLLPSSGTELMVRTSARHTGGVVFTASGEVTAFFGKNYLLPRAVTRRFESGNLRK